MLWVKKLPILLRRNFYTTRTVGEHSPVTFTQWNIRGVHRGWKFAHDFNFVIFSRSDFVAIYQNYHFTNILDFLSTRGEKKYWQSYEMLLLKLKHLRSHGLFVFYEYVSGCSPTCRAKVAKLFPLGNGQVDANNRPFSTPSLFDFSNCSWHVYRFIFWCLSFHSSHFCFVWFDGFVPRLRGLWWKVWRFTPRRRNFFLKWR